MPVFATRFLRWTWARAALARGWWLCTAVYLVVEGGLTPFQLVFIGVAQGITVVVAEVPAGVLADTVSRRLAVVLAHVLSGTGMLLTGFVTSFPLLVVTNCLWGLGWAFSSGADIAWLTDELDRPDLVDRVLARRARYDLLGAASGLLGFGVLAWATDLAPAIVVAGTAMVVLGVLVVARFPETRFVPAAGDRWAASLGVFRRGVDLARRDRELLVVILTVFLVNGAAGLYGRIFELHLLDLGFAGLGAPIAWFTALGLTCMAMGIVVLHVVEARIDGVGVAKRVYAASCFLAAAGMLAFAHAPDATTAVAAVLFIGGLAGPVARPMADIWVNRRTTSDVRATVHSFSSQAENLGEIVLGLGLALLVTAASETVAITGAVALTALAGLLAATVDEGAGVGVSE